MEDKRSQRISKDRSRGFLHSSRTHGKCYTAYIHIGGQFIASHLVDERLKMDLYNFEYIGCNNQGGGNEMDWRGTVSKRAKNW
jgi:hypothetical protein